MPRRVHVQRGPHEFDVIEVKAASELALQEALKRHPQLVPADDLGFDKDLIVVGRETGLSAGYIDLLLLASTGDLVLVEMKTGRQNPDFRHALAQLIDYGSDLWQMSLDDFDRGLVQRYLSSVHVRQTDRGARTLNELIARGNWGLDGAEIEAMMARLADVLSTGDFHFVVAAQGFTPSMHASVTYLNDMTRRGRYHLLEIIELQGGDLVAHATQLVAGPPAKGSASASPASRIDEAAFLDSVSDPAYRDALGDLLARCRSLGLRIVWGSTGASVRMPVADTQEPLSIGWIFGERPSWYGLTHFTVGYDPESLATRPSAEPAVIAFANRAAQLGGGSRAKGALVATTFSPDAVLANRETLAELIEDLVAAVNE